jgi:hypothetical protein
MKRIISYKLFEADKKWSDRDITNKYHCAKGWVRYEPSHKDSYEDIEKYFDITWDHLGWVLDDLVNTCDLLYGCSVRDERGMYLSHESSDGIADNITIDLLPANFGHNINFRTYISKFSHFPPKEDDVLYKLLQDIENKLEEDFPYLTIKYEGEVPVPSEQWNFFLTTSQITLKIKLKTKSKV